MPPYIREWQLLKLGVTLTELGYDEPPAVMLDWLVQLEGVFQHEKAKAMEVN